MRKFLLVFLAFILLKVNAQKDWREMLHEPNANFYTVQKTANKYWKKELKEHEEEERRAKSGGEEEELSGYEQYKRWEAFMEPRVYPTGDLSLPSKAWENYQAFLNETNSANKFGNNLIASSTWTAMGPFGAMTSSACGLPRKAGRDNFITFHPSVANTFWCGSPAGGLWKTTNNGTSWTTTTDNLAVIGCSDLAIDPTNPNIMYLATGDGDAGDTFSTGVLKSTDGGNTWAVTGLNWAVSLQRNIRRLIINPINPQIIIAASSAGIWRTTNGGTTWASTSALNAYDVEFKPTNPNIAYATGATAFYRSTNGGGTWTLISSGIATSGNTRYAVAVTPADTNYVYVLISNSAYNFGGLLRSTVGGTAFTTMSTSPDLICNACTGVASGNGQGWYDLALHVNPLNKDEVVVGGVNHWRSTNGGAAWTIIGCWNGTTSSPPYVHADVHEVEFNSSGTLYTCNDGGVYQWTGTAWTDLTSPRNISQQYRIGLSGTTANYWITGHQDNGSNIFNGTTYDARQCGDGMDCFIDRTNNNNAFCSGPNGGFYRSTNAGLAWTSCPAPAGGYWVTPWKQDPISAATIWAGKTNMYKSTNLAASWAVAGTIPGNAAQAVIEFAIAPSNNDVIYAIHGNTGVYKTANATAATPTWAVTGTLPVGTAAMTWVCIDPTDPNNAWVTFSGYAAGTKVYETQNGGTTWTNVSSNLPNLPVNCIMYEPGTSDRVYVGMDVGVYYKDASGPNWTLYNAGLPNVPVHDMEINSVNPGKIFAATYGRGTYKVDVVTAAPPVSNFSVAAAPYCTGTNILFTDNSSNVPTSWSWSVSPSTGVTITTPTSQNPTFNFTSAGSYVISMQATNGIGTGSIASQTVVVTATPTINVTVASQTVCAGTAVTYTASGGTTYAWTGGGVATVNSYTPASSTVYTVVGTTSGCSSQKTASVTVNTLPSVSVSGVNSICIGNSSLLTASGATTYTWSTAATTTTISVTPTITTTYSVTGTGANGCKNTFNYMVTVNPLPTINLSGSSSVICLGQNANLNASGASTYTWNPGGLTGAAVVTTPVSNITYTCTGMSGAGCSNTAMQSVTVNPLPTVSASTSSSLICTGQTATLTASGAVTYTWNPGGVSGTSVAFSPTINTTYSVTGTSAIGCNNVAMLTVSVSACTGVQQMVSANGYNIFPNPTSGKVNIQLNVSKATTINAELMDASGKIIMKQVLNYNTDETTQTLNISSLANGIYFINLSGVDGKKETIRIIKE